MITIVNKRNHTPTSYDYYIGRPTMIGNPYTHKPNSKYGEIIVDSRDIAIDNYRYWLKDKIMSKDFKVLNELKDLLMFYKTNG